MNKSKRNKVTSIIFWVLMITVILPIGFFIDTFNTDPANVELNELRYSTYVIHNPSKGDLHNALTSNYNHIDVLFNKSLNKEYHDNLFTNYKLKKSMVESINTNAQLNQDLWNYFLKDGVPTNNNISLIERKGEEQQHNFTLIHSYNFTDIKSHMNYLVFKITVAYTLIIMLWISVITVIVSIIDETIIIINEKKELS